jgi:hypothetical protein
VAYMTSYNRPVVDRWSTCAAKGRGSLVEEAVYKRE